MLCFVSMKSINYHIMMLLLVFCFVMQEKPFTMPVPAAMMTPKRIAEDMVAMQVAASNSKKHKPNSVSAANQQDEIEDDSF